MKAGILQDWGANAGIGRAEARCSFTVPPRLFSERDPPLRWLGAPIVVLYVLYVEWGLGIELNLKSKIGSRIATLSWDRTGRA